MIKNLVVRLPGDLHGEFFERAEAVDDTPSQLVRRWIKAYLATPPERPKLPPAPLPSEGTSKEAAA